MNKETGSLNRETIDRVETALVSMRDDTLATSYGPSVARRDHVFVRVWTTSGAFGLGEASPLPHFTGEVGDEIKRTIDHALGPSIRGLNPFDITKIETALHRRLPHHTTAKAAIITAVYDLVGRLLDLPVYRLLGGKLRDKVEIATGVGIGTTSATLTEVEQLAARGVGTVKLKIGSDPKRDIAIVRAVRERFPELKLRADANQGYTPKVAVAVLREIEDCDLQYVEQPVAADDLVGLQAVAAATSVRIAVDESLYSLKNAMGLISLRAADVFVIKLIKTSGIRQARAIMELAQASHIPCVVVSPYEGQLGMAADIHVAAASPNCTWAVELGLGDRVEEDPCEGLSFHRGYVEVPMGPGLGITLSQDVFAP
jgi:o-succinylbenzoate synthase